MFEFTEGKFDVVVIGAGHAGVEAAAASAKLNKKTAMLTLNLDSIAFMACNPSIGGTAKGHLVREIDALGGMMGKIADKALLQIRMLNLGKGAAVHSLRGQEDKNLYHTLMKKALEETDNLKIIQGEASEILVENGKVVGVKTAYGGILYADAVVICSGVYLNGSIITGEWRRNSGPNGFQPANELTESLIKLGFNIRRFKTGTPARVDKRTIDFSKCEIQEGEEVYPFSYQTTKLPERQEPCYLTYTNQKTHEIILANLHRSPLYGGMIKGTGPRYCPSIEDKVVRFKDKERHQIFLEPEGKDTNEVYVQGMSTSLPHDVQKAMYRTIPGLEKVEIMRYAYAIEYDCIDALDLKPTLEFKKVNGLFTAGQVNGTSGYEEAAIQGLVAGINASLYIDKKEPFVLKRDNSYGGVLIDDLVTKGTNEPYRIMTSRAEHRIHLRQDNADFRLTKLGREIGLVDDKAYENFLNREKLLKLGEEKLNEKAPSKEARAFLKEEIDMDLNQAVSYRDMIKKGISLKKIKERFNILEEVPFDILETLEIDAKYEGYLKRGLDQIEKAKKLEDKLLPPDIDYLAIEGLRIEARQKLDKIKPLNIGQASRISGVNPADITVLMVYLRQKGF
ncbi:MAG: tRNA uridine-5-carboxymethylaminomethyl(34) synthesis enzyme MnmG [Clostridia bacterium]|nr:tRNA uridine-5-carboxymethylaminomethyl(34) synthesis enzyme MnmG [Clostridia bacterium]